MTKTSRFLSKFGALLLCGMLLSGCASKDMEISNSFFPDGVEAYDAKVAQWKFERAERIRIAEEEKARKAAEKEAAKQARLQKKAEKSAEAVASGEVAHNVQPVEAAVLTAPQPMPEDANMQTEAAMQPAPLPPQQNSMIPMDDSSMTPMPGDGMAADDTMSPMPITPASEQAGPMDLTAPPAAEEAPADTLQNEGSISREEFEKLMREKQMQQQYMEMRDEQLTIHPFLIFGESSESSTLIMKPGGAPLATEADDPDLPPAVEVFPVWEEGQADAPSIYESGGAATHESVTVFPLDGPYNGPVPVLEVTPLNDRPGWGGVRVVNSSKATSGLNQPGVSYSVRPVSIAGNPYLKQSIFFDHASKRLSANDRKKLAAIVRKINDGTVKLVRVIGHASRRTATKNATMRDVVNYRYSLARAGAVTTALIEDGLPAQWLEVTGYGDTLPAAGVSADQEEAANRRVDVMVYLAK